MCVWYSLTQMIGRLSIIIIQDKKISHQLTTHSNKEQSLSQKPKCLSPTRKSSVTATAARIYTIHPSLIQSRLFYRQNVFAKNRPPNLSLNLCPLLMSIRDSKADIDVVYLSGRATDMPHSCFFAKEQLSIEWINGWMNRSIDDGWVEGNEILIAGKMPRGNLRKHVKEWMLAACCWFAREIDRVIKSWDLRCKFVFNNSTQLRSVSFRRRRILMFKSSTT